MGSTSHGVLSVQLRRHDYGTDEKLGLRQSVSKLSYLIVIFRAGRRSLRRAARSTPPCQHDLAGAWEVQPKRKRFDGRICPAHSSQVRPRRVWNHIHVCRSTSSRRYPYFSESSLSVKVGDCFHKSRPFFLKYSLARSSVSSVSSLVLTDSFNIFPQRDPGLVRNKASPRQIVMT